VLRDRCARVASRSETLAPDPTAGTESSMCVRHRERRSRPAYRSGAAKAAVVIMSSAEILENDCLGIVCGLVKRSDAPHERRAVQRGGDVAVEVRFTRAVAARRSGNVGRFHHKSLRHARWRVGSVPCDEKGERRNGGVDLLVDTDVHDGAGLQGSGTAQPVRKRSRGKRGIAQAGPWGDSRDSGGCLTDGA